MITLKKKGWNKTTKVHSLSNQVILHVSPHINEQTTEVLLKNVQALESEQIQINGNEMFENVREFLENHTYLKAYLNQRNVKAQDFSKCRFKCNANVSDESRQSIMSFYYALRSTSLYLRHHKHCKIRSEHWEEIRVSSILSIS
jgi:hypothetical protein